MGWCTATSERSSGRHGELSPLFLQKLPSYVIRLILNGISKVGTLGIGHPVSTARCINIAYALHAMRCVLIDPLGGDSAAQEEDTRKQSPH